MKATVGSLMSPCPYVAQADKGLDDVRRLMTLHSIRHVPISNDGELVGLVSEHDLALADAIGHAKNYSPSLVDICQKEPLIILESEPLVSLAKNMASQRKECALVINSVGDLVGIFTITDALNSLHRILTASSS